MQIDVSDIPDSLLDAEIDRQRRSAEDDSRPPWRRAYHESLVRALQCIALNRLTHYGELQDAARVPSTWEQAVESLPPEPPREEPEET